MKKHYLKCFGTSSIPIHKSCKPCMCEQRVTPLSLSFCKKRVCLKPTANTWSHDTTLCLLHLARDALLHCAITQHWGLEVHRVIKHFSNYYWLRAKGSMQTPRQERPVKTHTTGEKDWSCHQVKLGSRLLHRLNITSQKPVWSDKMCVYWSYYWWCEGH